MVTEDIVNSVHNVVAQYLDKRSGFSLQFFLNFIFMKQNLGMFSFIFFLFET